MKKPLFGFIAYEKYSPNAVHGSNSSTCTFPYTSIDILKILLQKRQTKIFKINSRTIIYT